MSNNISNIVNNFKNDPTNALAMLEVAVGFDLNHSERSMATVLGLQAAAGDTVSLSSLVDAWLSSPMLCDFASAINRRFLVASA